MAAKSRSTHASLEQHLRAEESNARGSASRRLLRATVLGTAMMFSHSVVSAPNTAVGAKLASAYNPEASRLSAVLIATSPFENAADSKYLKPPFVAEVLNEAEWISEDVGVSKELVLAHLLTEAGKLQDPSCVALGRNNIGGIMDSNNKTARFGNLHDFARKYAAILKNAGVSKADDLYTFVEKIWRKGYFKANKNAYRKCMLGVLHTMSKAGEGYNKYYAKMFARDAIRH